MMAAAGGEGVPVLELYRQFSYFMALDIDVSGATSPPGRDKGVVYVRLPVVEYEDEGETSLEDYPVHEYHLLRLLDNLLQRRSISKIPSWLPSRTDSLTSRQTSQTSSHPTSVRGEPRRGTTWSPCGTTRTSIWLSMPPWPRGPSSSYRA
jgi:hypothetical protein